MRQGSLQLTACTSKDPNAARSIPRPAKTLSLMESYRYFKPQLAFPLACMPREPNKPSKILFLHQSIKLRIWIYLRHHYYCTDALCISTCMHACMHHHHSNTTPWHSQVNRGQTRGSMLSRGALMRHAEGGARAEKSGGKGESA